MTGRYVRRAPKHECDPPPPVDPDLDRIGDGWECNECTGRWTVVRRELGNPEAGLMWLRDPALTRRRGWLDRWRRRRAEARMAAELDRWQARRG